MSSPDSVRDNLIAHIDAATAALETEVPAINAAAQRLARCLLDESRIFCCGTASAAMLAQHFTVKLMGRLERERPGLPVFCLSDSAALMSALAENFGAQDVFARQLRALGMAGDVLVIVASGSLASAFQAIVAAHDRGMDVIVFSGREHDELRQVLREEDIEINVATASLMRAEEVQFLLLNLLADEVEKNLFGDMHA